MDEYLIGLIGNLEDGPIGPGDWLPSGGNSGDVLRKNSDADYDAGWYAASSQPTADAVALFDANGNLKSGTPVEDEDVVTLYAFRNSELATEVQQIKAAFDAESTLVDATELRFSSGTIASTGAINATTTSKIRTAQGTAPVVRKGDFYESDAEYQIRVAVYTSRTMQAGAFVAFVNDFKSGRVYIPDEYTGKYASVLIQKVGATSDDISADVPAIGEHVKHYSNRQFILNAENLRQSVVTGTDINLLDPLSQTATTSNGITFAPTLDGAYTVSGTASATAYKEIRANAMDNWPFEPGKTYRAAVEGNTSGSIVWLRMFKRVNGALVDAQVFSTKDSTFFTYPEDAEGYAFRLYVYRDNTVDNTIKATVTREIPAERLRNPHNIAFFGDSIMLGANGSSATEGQWTPYSIPQTVATRLGATYSNYGVSSMGYVTTASTGQNAYDRITSSTWYDYDTFVLCFGVNDGFQPIGAFDSADESTCLGQFNKIVQYLGTTYPSKRIIVIAPFNGRNAGSFPKYWYGAPGGNAYSRGALSDTLKQACEYYNIPYIEQKNGPINGYSIQTLIGEDGVHPNNAGYIALGGWLSGEISRLIG